MYFFGAEKPLYRTRCLTRGISTLNTSHGASSSSLIDEDDEEEDQEFEGLEIEFNDTEAFESENLID